MQINVTFDQSVASLPQGFVTAVDYVVALLDRAITNNITVNIDVGFGEINGVPLGASDLGESETYLQQFGYSEVVSALDSNEGANGLTTAVSDLPSRSPSRSGLEVPLAEAQALGLVGSSSQLDGYVGFSSSALFDYSTTVAPSSGEYDFVGVAEHEITEVLGRISGIDQGYVTVFDLYRYSAPGTHAFSPKTAPNSSVPAYFSLDNGVTDLGNFNTYSGGDYGDWGSSNGETGVPGNPNDAFNAYSSAGVVNSLSQTDLEVLRSLGYVASFDFLWPDDFLGAGVSDLLFESSSSGAVVVGQMNDGALSYTQVASLSPGWTLEGDGDFLGDGNEDFLMESANGAVVVGDVVNGAASFEQVGGLGPEWSFVGTGDFLNNGQDQFLIENASGAVVVGDVVSGQAQYTQVAGLGPGWSFEGTGDFLGDGATGFLIENSSGAVDVGEVSNGTANFTQIGALGSGWTFVGTGDFLGLGYDQFLIENSNGALDVANVVNGQAQYSQVGSLGPEWRFIGTGDYFGTGPTDFMIENTAGAVALGTIAGGQASFAQVGALGAEWTSHS